MFSIKIIYDEVNKFLKITTCERENDFLLIGVFSKLFNLKKLPRFDYSGK